MARITFTCANPACGLVCRKDWQLSRPPPRYCSIPCAGVHTNAQRKAAGLVVWHKYAFTESMNDAIRRAYRGKFGALKRLWHDDPRFEHAGIPYAILKRQCKVLGLARTVPDDTWLPEETAYCAQLVAAGHAYETIVKKMRLRGWHRTPSAIIQHTWVTQSADRYGAFLSTHQLALALGIDDHVLARWTARGLLLAHHTDGWGTWYTYEAVRAFVVAQPYLVGRGAPHIPWLVGVLCPPQVGDTRERRQGPGAADDTSWLTGAPVCDRAAAD